MLRASNRLLLTTSHLRTSKQFKVMINLVKTHESGVKTANHENQVNAILDNVENTPFALRGANVKTILYGLFSVIAAVELSAALYFYACSLGVPQAVSMVVCGVIAFGFHFLLHSILTDTSKGIVFGKKSESGAMSNEVTANIILSIVLLLLASLTVFFVGKKGFTAYRATQYEIAEKEAVKPNNDININDVKLKDKNGKIAAWKLETLTDLKKAEATKTEKETAKADSERSRYDATTSTITDIVGASAFILELLLALLAYTIATAKKAAVMDALASRQKTGVQDATTLQPLSNQATNIINNTPTPSVNRKQIGFLQMPGIDQLNEVHRIQNVLPNVPMSKIFKVLEDSNCVVPLSLEDILHLFGTQQTATTTTEPQPNNTGRTIIKGFQNSITDAVERMPLTASVDKSKLKVCLHCEKEYIYKIHNQKYCSEPCRISAWEHKTGVKLRKNK